MDLMPCLGCAPFGAFSREAPARHRPARLWIATLLPLLLLGALLLQCTGCVMQRNFVDGELVSSELGFGIASHVPVCHQDELTVTERKVLGLEVSPSGVAAGYTDVEILCAPARCQITLWVESDEQLHDLNRLIPDLPNVCVSKK
jgi:hypothetical protein